MNITWARISGRVIHALLSFFILGTLNLWSAIPAKAGDDHPYFPSEFHATEGSGEATISVVRDSGAGSVKVTYSTKPSDATEGVDYQPVIGELTFGEGERGPKYFRVPIIDDKEAEPDETVLLLLYDASGQAIDFSELVIQSNEPYVEDPGDNPGAESAKGSAGAASGRAGNSGGRKAGSPGPSIASDSGGSSQDGLVAGEIPTIVLGYQKDLEETTSPKEVNRKTRLASASTAATGPIKVLWAVSALALAAGVCALWWLKTRGTQPPAE